MMRATELPTPPVAWRRRTGVVVVGTGAAGLSAVLPLIAGGIETVVITRGAGTDSATDWAQGGLAAVWGSDDSLTAHVADTLAAGAGRCDREAVLDLVAAAPGAIRRLVELGAQFDLTAAGDFDLHLEGGHSRRRIIHANGDATGHEIERALWASLASVLPLRRSAQPTAKASDSGPGSGLLAPNSALFEQTRLVDLLTDADGAACGVRVLATDGEVGEWLADAVVLATGGLGQLWPVTTNPGVATGDGVAAARRAGAQVRDLEFIQFHPTVLADAGATQRGVLISEAVRGEGAVLVDGAGRRIMAGIHPLADLAPRDVISAAIMEQLDRTGEASAFLDATSFGARKWEQHFPGILRLCRARGIDPVNQPIPVHPAAHYSCGGVAADLWGRTSVPGLYAVGEVAATGVHGANRLASNSLPEALVMGERVGRLLAAGVARGGDPVARAEGSIVDGGALPALKQAARRDAFVSRNVAGLARLMRQATSAPQPLGQLNDTALTSTNLHLVAAEITAAALTRAQSAGCHRRVDEPSPQFGELLRSAVRLALDEDLAFGPDVTTLTTVPNDRLGTADVVARQPGVIAGIPVALEVLAEYGRRASVAFNIDVRTHDGGRVEAGDVVLTIQGPVQALLTAERTLLNFLGQLSGVASATATWVDAVAGTGASIRDTRKTVPGLRALQKYAVVCGGGINHRMALGDAALIKDNHIAAAGSLSAAYLAVKQVAPEIAIEVECDTLTQVREAVAIGAQLVLLDNMSPDDLRAAVTLCHPAGVQTEASGGLILASAKEVAATGVDFLAIGALTHSSQVLDLGLDLRS